MITLCWAAKGGSGTTVFAASLALASPRPTLLVDLDRDLPAVLGLAEPESPGVHEWLESGAPPGRLSSLEVEVRDGVTLLPGGPRSAPPAARWHELALALAGEHRDIVIDAGTRPPPSELCDVADRVWLVTRACYLALRAAARSAVSSNGVVLVAERGRALQPADVEASIGAPIRTVVLDDPAVARAVDAGLLIARLPAGMTRELRRAA